MAPFEALHGRRYISPIGLFEVGDSLLLSPEIVYEAFVKVCVIRDRLKMTYSWRKSYADNRKTNLEIEVGDKVYLKISPMKRVMRFGKKRKLSPRYVGPYEVLQKVIMVPYEMRLPSELASIHLVFRDSMLKKWIVDPVSIFRIEGLGVDEDLSYEEVPVEILDFQAKELRNKKVTIVKIQCGNYLVEGATWEAEDDMKSCYPHIFLAKKMNTRRNVAQRLEEEITNVGVPPRGDQVPPLDKDVNDDQAPVNLPPLKDSDIRVALFQMSQTITT
nr:uncharacterized protein LOC101247491 [Solanum lycopersicum]